MRVGVWDPSPTLVSVAPAMITRLPITFGIVSVSPRIMLPRAGSDAAHTWQATTELIIIAHLANTRLNTSTRVKTDARTSKAP